MIHQLESPELIPKCSDDWTAQLKVKIGKDQ